MYKKIFAASMAMVMAASTLFGCAQNEGKQNQETSSSQVKEQKTEEETAVVKKTTESVVNTQDFDEEDYTRVRISDGKTESSEDGIVILESTKENTIYLKDTSISSEVSGTAVDVRTVTISKPGVYIITGTLEAGQIVVDCAEKGTVELIFNEVDISNEKNSPVYVKDAKKVLLVLAEDTENLLCDAETYTYEDAENEEPSACLFSKEDLVISGGGSLKVQGNYNNGIASKDTLKITGGTIEVTAENNGIKGKDCVLIAGGDITATAGGDGIKSDNDTDEGMGYIRIYGGTFHINAKNDGIHAESSLTVSGGDIDIEKSSEGIESPEIIVEGGNISIVASDDGINAAGGETEQSGSAFGKGGMMSTSTGTLTIDDGYLYVNAGGDGLDANGDLTINGGTVIVEGPENDGNTAVDYDGNFAIHGGFLMACGSAGMVESVSDSSTQNSVTGYFSETLKAGSSFAILDSSGNLVAAFDNSKVVSSFIFSSDELVTGEEYTVYTMGSCDGTAKDGLYTDGTYTGGTEADSFQVSSTVTTMGSGGMGGFGGPRGNGGNGNFGNQGENNGMGGFGKPGENGDMRENADMGANGERLEMPQMKQEEGIS